MNKRKIGPFEVNPIGLGCMGLSAFYGPPTDHAEAVRLLRQAVDLGVDHFDTAELYGRNEELLGEALEGLRDRIRIATKFGPKFTFDENGKRVGQTIDGSPANMRRAVENSLRYLRTDHIDLYYLHRLDPNTPVEETVGAMGELVKEGKVLAIGLSEVNGDTFAKANATHPVAAVQSEYSIFTRDVETVLFDQLRAAGATLVAYSPLGRGLLTGSFSKDRKPGGQGEFRSGDMQPRWAEGAYEANLALVDEVKAIADEIGATPGQVALAWVLSRGEDIVTIPGTTKLKNLESNLDAAAVTLSEGHLKRLEPLADKVQGARYNEMGMAAVNR